MNKVFEITEMRIEDKGGRISDINIVEAFLKKYDHPDSIPHEILLKTNDMLDEGEVIELQYLIKDEKEFRKAICKISDKYKKYQDEPNEYILQ